MKNHHTPRPTTAGTNRPAMSPDLVTLPEAGRILGLSDNTMYRMAANELQRPEWILKLGRSYRVSVPRLKRWLHGEAA